MGDIEYTDALIVGSGPAGISTALHLLQSDANWARRMAVLDKAVHPREKLCGGGVTQTGEAVLTRLGLPFEPEHVFIRELRFVYRGQTYALRDNPVFRITRRAEFDHWLALQAEKRGATLYQGEAVTDIIPHSEAVEVVTEKRVFQAKTVVVADGSRSFARRKLKWPGDKRMARLLEILTLEKARFAEGFEYQDGVAIFDFSRMREGLQGYYWDFPTLLKGQPFMNRGIFDSRAGAKRPRAPLKQFLDDSLAERGYRLGDYPLKGHPIHCFDPQGEFARPRIILAGDAAGVDPVVGEGIAFALQYGAVAAAAIADAFNRKDFSFSSYRQRILGDPLLSQLSTRAKLARFVYSLKYGWQFDAAWKLLPLLLRFLAWSQPQSLPFKSPRLLRKGN